MKNILFGLILAMLGVNWAGAQMPISTGVKNTPTGIKKLSMTKSEFAAYKEARDAKDWVKAESLTVFPDVKAWDENNIGFNYYKIGEYEQAHGHFLSALKLSKEADACGRSTNMAELRKLIEKDELAIQWHRDHPDDTATSGSDDSN